VNRVSGGISGSREPSPAVSALTGFDPGRVEIASWALKTVNEMAAMGIIQNTVEARGAYLDSVLAVLLATQSTGETK
jgi:hypothetical protein